MAEVTTLGTLTAERALDRTDLVAAPVAEALAGLPVGAKMSSVPFSGCLTSMLISAAVPGHELDAGGRSGIPWCCLEHVTDRLCGETSRPGTVHLLGETFRGRETTDADDRRRRDLL